MPRSKESLNFLLVSSLLHVASEVLIKTVQSVASRLNTTLEQLLALHRHSFFHSWKNKKCCQCQQSFENPVSVLSSEEWNRMFQKNDEECERASQVECSCCYQARDDIDTDSFTITISSCILENSTAMEENELRNVQQIRYVNEKLAQNRDDATLTEDMFTSLSNDLNKALHDMSKKHGDEYYNDIVETIQKIDHSDPDDEETRKILERFDKDNQVLTKTEERREKPFTLEYQRVDSMRSDISVCGSDEELSSCEKFDDHDPVALAESQILKSAENNSVDLEDSYFDDEEDEENEYGNLLKRMKEKFNYLSEKCLAVGSELTNVRRRMTNTWPVPETKAQPEEVLRQELREIEMMRKFIDNDLDDVRTVYVPYEDFHSTSSPGAFLDDPYKKLGPTYSGQERVVRPPRPTFESYTRLQSINKQLSQSLSSINSTFKRNIRVANTLRLDPLPRKYDQGIVKALSAGDVNPKPSPLVSSISRYGDEDEGVLSIQEDLDPVGRAINTAPVMFKIDYSKYEKCIKDSEKVLNYSPEIGKDVGSILCERQHGHFLKMYEQQSNDLVRKCENLRQDIQQLKSKFDSCEQLLSENLHQIMPKQCVEEDMVDCEVKYTPVKTSLIERTMSPIPRMKFKSSTPRLAVNNSTPEPQWNEYTCSLNLEIPSEDSDDEESALEKRHGDSLRKLHAECESLRARCTQSKRHIREARVQMNNSSSHLDLFENQRYEPRIEDDLDEPDSELSDIKWKHDILDESFDSAYHTVASGRSTGYSTRSRPTSSRSRYTGSVTPSVTLSTPRLPGEDRSLAYTPRSLYSQGYESDDEFPAEDCYTPYETKLSSRPKKKSPILIKPRFPHIGTPDYSCKIDYGEDTDDVELEMEKQHGDFLEKCKSDFLTISSKSLELKQEIRRLRVDMALPLAKKQEPKLSPVPERRLNMHRNLRIPKLDIDLESWTKKVSPYKTTEKYADKPDSDDNDESNITSFEKELSVAEQSYGNFLSSMKSNFDTLNEKSMRTKQEIRALRQSLRNPLINKATCGGQVYHQSFYNMPMELHSY